MGPRLMGPLRQALKQKVRYLVMPVPVILLGLWALALRPKVCPRSAGQGRQQEGCRCCVRPGGRFRWRQRLGAFEGPSPLLAWWTSGVLRVWVFRPRRRGCLLQVWVSARLPWAQPQVMRWCVSASAPCAASGTGSTASSVCPSDSAAQASAATTPALPNAASCASEADRTEMPCVAQERPCSWGHKALVKWRV